MNTESNPLHIQKRTGTRDGSKGQKEAIPIGDIATGRLAKFRDGRREKTGRDFLTEIGPFEDDPAFALLILGLAVGVDDLKITDDPEDASVTVP